MVRPVKLLHAEIRGGLDHRRKKRGSSLAPNRTGCRAAVIHDGGRAGVAADATTSTLVRFPGPRRMGPHVANPATWAFAWHLLLQDPRSSRAANCENAGRSDRDSREEAKIGIG